MPQRRKKDPAEEEREETVLQKTWRDALEQLSEVELESVSQLAHTYAFETIAKMCNFDDEMIRRVHKGPNGQGLGNLFWRFHNQNAAASANVSDDKKDGGESKT